MSVEDDNALYALAFGEDSETLPERFQGFSPPLRIVRFLARRVYNLEKGVR